MARIVKEEIHNVGVPSQGNKVPSKDNQAPLNEQIPQGDEVPTISPPITDGGIRSSFVCFSQAMPTEAQTVATQDQFMVAQAN